MPEWEILFTDEVGEFLDGLYESDPVTHKAVNEAVLALERLGPALGRTAGRHDHRVQALQPEGVASRVN